MALKCKIITNPISCREIVNTPIKLCGILIILIIVISATNIIQDVFAQLTHETQIPFTNGENLTVYVHILSKPFDSGTVEFHLGKYYEEQAYITDATGDTTVQFNPPLINVNIGYSYHIAAYSSTQSLCGFSNGQNHPINQRLDIYVELQPCTTR